MAWNDLSLSDKARMMQLAVKSGITDLRTIEEVYNKYAEGGYAAKNDITSLDDMKDTYNNIYDTANIYWPGGWMPAGNIIRNISKVGEAVGERLANKEFAKKAVNWYKEHAEKIPDKVHKITYDTLKDTGFSGELSDIVHNVRHNIKNEVNDDNVFLMPQNRQQKALEKLGYRKVEEPDYGLVNAAVQKYKEVTGREVPMYQKGEDEITREELIPLDNADLYGPTGSFREVITPWGTSGAETKVITNNENIGDTANTPTRYYRDKNGNIYVKSWDFFDHGNYSRTDYNDEVRGGYVTRALTDMSQEFGNLLDEAGNPFVKTTGYKKVYPPEEPIINGDVENETVRERLKKYNDNKNSMATGLITAILGYDTFGGKYNYDADNAIKDILEGQYDIKKYGGNLLGEGGPTQESSYGKLNKAWKEAVKKVADKVGVSKDKVEQYYNDGRLMPAIAAWYQLSNNGMVRENDSPTKELSEARAISQNKGLYGNISHRDKLPQSGAPNMDYAVPYLEDKEIKIKNAGRTTTNALDSIAKYAGLAGISLQEGLGLFKQETGLGSVPYGNVQNTSKGKTQEEKDKIKETNRALLNNNYFRQFGWIPAEYMVRDFRYNLDGYEIDRNIPPLLHAFTLFKKGDYNRGDPNHTRDVLNAGELVLQDKGVQDWIKSSKYTKGVKIRK